MKETVPRVLAHAERALIVSLYDGVRIIYVNDAMRQFLPGVHEDMLIDEMSAQLDHVYEHKYRSPPFGLRVVDSLKKPGDTASRHTTMLGGYWVIASHLPEVTSYPPCGLVTFHKGGRFQESRAWRVHRPLAHAASLALEIDEAKRELEVASQMVVQSHGRMQQLADSLVEFQADQIRELAEGGIQLD